MFKSFFEKVSQFFSGIGLIITDSIGAHKVVFPKYRAMVFWILFLYLVIAGFAFANKVIQGMLLNNLSSSTSGDHKMSIFLAILLIISLVFPRFLGNIRDYLNTIFSREVEHYITDDLIINKTATLDIAIIEDPKFNNLFTRATSFGQNRLQMLISRTPAIFSSLFTLISTMVSVFWFSPIAFLVLFVTSFPELIIENYYAKKTYGLYARNSELMRKRGSIRQLFSLPSSLTELKLYATSRYFIDKISDMMRSFLENAKKDNKQYVFMSTLSLVVSQIGVAGITFWVLSDVFTGVIKIGTFVFLFQMIVSFQNSLSDLFGKIGRQHEDCLYIKDLLKVLEVKNELPISSSPITISHNNPTIEFRNVSFVYPGSEKKVFDNLSLTINPGEKLAIIGINGAGKSTFIKLFLRFYDPTEGDIFVNGVNLKEIDLQDYYSLIGSLFQDYPRYPLVLRDAIGVGSIQETITDKRVRDALQKSEAIEFVSQWEKGFDQQLGRIFSEGMEPSVGQWQKLALARVFYRDANIYVLDEPTSAIDAEAEANVFANLAALPSDKTVIFVSHRFSTIRQANRICVIENGTISELGTHEQLIANKATYKRLFELQRKGYE